MRRAALFAPSTVRAACAPLLLSACTASLFGAACAPSLGATAAQAPTGAGVAAAAERDRARTADFARVEDDALAWLAAADPRLALRANMNAPEAVLRRIGTEAVLAEDATTKLRGSSLDLFSFKARARALAEAAKAVAAFRADLPEAAPLGSALARPKLERELLARLIDEETARAESEAKLGDASGDLVRALVATWTPPPTPQDWTERDDWVSKHLLEIRDSMRAPGPRSGPPDLDVALYPLERLLAPLQFPRGSAAIAQIRMGLDEDMRAVPKLDTPERIAREVSLHLGVALDARTMRPRLERLEQRLRELASHALSAASPAEKPAMEARARELLLIEGPCPPAADSKVRTMGPPPERAVLCSAVRALAEETAPGAAVVALHDDILLSFAAVGDAPPRTGLLSHPEDDTVDSLERMARERPVVALGVALAAELLYGAADPPDDRLRAWRALGDAPLDIVARELGVTPPSP